MLGIITHIVRYRMVIVLGWGVTNNSVRLILLDSVVPAEAGIHF